MHGHDNEVADALSRITISAVLLEDGIDYEQMAAEQRSEGISISSATSHLQELPVPSGTVLLVCNTKTGDPRPKVPSTFREKVIQLLPNLSHPSIRATTNLIASRCFWDGMKKDVRTWARNCVLCQRAKVQQHN